LAISFLIVGLIAGSDARAPLVRRSRLHGSEWSWSRARQGSEGRREEYHRADARVAIENKRGCFGGDVDKAANREHPKLLSSPDKPSIAVLPFENMSGDPNKNISSTVSLKTC
jgi:hypothetical protein